MSYGYGFRTDNPIADFDRGEFERTRIGKIRPTCNICGEKIYTGTVRRRGDEIICNDCYENVYEEIDVEDFI